MKTLLKSATIIDPGSAHHLQTCDLLIEGGFITKIDSSLADKADRTVVLPNLHISVGWFDPGVSFGEPGMEERETLNNGLKTAARSGFSAVAISSNTQPVPDSRSGIEYIRSKSGVHGVNALPLGALTMNAEGTDLAELFDMYREGAAGFSDHKKPVANANLLKIALQYCQNFEGLVHSFPLEPSLAYKGVMNEGVNSTKLGMKGIPALAEAVQIERDLRILEYTGGKLHIPTVSTAEGVELIKKAKDKGLEVSCSVSINNLLLHDDVLGEYDSRYKLLPPLRTPGVSSVLIEALKEGIIDGVTTDHTPLNIELKNTEFELSAFGSIGLESGFGALCAVTDLETAIVGYTRLRNTYGLPERSIEVGQPAEISLFDPQLEWKFTANEIISSNKNAALLEQSLKGKAYGILSGDHLELSE